MSATAAASSAAVAPLAVSRRSCASARCSTAPTPAVPASLFSFRRSPSSHIVTDSSNRRQLVRCRAGQRSESPAARAAATAAAGVSVAAVALVAAHTGLAHAAELGDAASEAVLEAAAIAPGELVDETFADFNVEFAGRVWDHKTIVYALVFGQWVGFIGALVGGNSARQRKEEVEQLNQKLLQVNQQLRAAARKSQRDLKVKETPAAEAKKTADWLVELRKGKSLLKDRDGGQAQAAFEKALVLLRSAEGLQSPWKAERKALRGLSAAHRLMGEKQVALEYILKVIDLCDTHGDRSAKGDALGVVADLYTDIGDFDKAAQYYDLYLAEIGDAMGSIDVDPSNTQVSV